MRASQARGLVALVGARRKEVRLLTGIVVLGDDKGQRMGREEKWSLMDQD